MPQKSRPDPANGTVVTADEYEALGLQYANDGVYGHPSDSAVVFADSTGRQVKVRAGKRAIVRGYEWFSDPTADEIIGNLPANTSTNPRIDRLVLRLNRTARTVRTLHLVGTPAVTPVAPSLTQTTSISADVFDFPLARWQVAAGYTTIAAGDIVTEYWCPQAGGPILCNSTSRPFGVTRVEGLKIREIDTDFELTWDGAYFVPAPGSLIKSGWLAQNVGSLDNGDRLIWQAVVNIPCPGDYRIFTTTPLDGADSEQARIWMNVNGSYMGGRIARFAAFSYVEDFPNMCDYIAPNTTPLTIQIRGMRITGGSFYQSRAGNRFYTVTYLGPSSLYGNY